MSLKMAIAESQLIPTVKAISLRVIHMLSVISATISAWWSTVCDVEGQPDLSQPSIFVLPHLNQYTHMYTVFCHVIFTNIALEIILQI